MTEKIAVIIGAGPGLGLSLGKFFGKNGFTPVLVSRSEEKLAKLVSDLKELGIDSFTETGDASDAASLKTAMANIKVTHGAPTVMIYNAADTRPGAGLRVETEELVQHFRLDVAGAWTVCRDLIEDPEFLQNKGALLFTGGGFGIHPFPAFGAMSLTKAALRSYAYMLNEALAPKGIYAGTVTINGPIGMNDFFSADRIAEAFYELYEKRTECEKVYEYPELVGFKGSGAEYWSHVFPASKEAESH